MVNVDRVYQKVLALANKEQRGYITPQEFNLFADMAQMEIFEQYFYDLNQFNRLPGNQTSHSDMRDLLEGKISAFEVWATNPNTTLLNDFGDINLEDFFNFYRLVEVRVNSGNNLGYRVAEEMTTKEFRKYTESPLAKESERRPIYIHYFNSYDRIKIYPFPPKTTPNTGFDDIRISYIRKPKSPKWTYIVTAAPHNTALYNPTAPDISHFELHASEESELVYRILALAGISLQKPEVLQSAVGLEAAKVQQEKS